MAHKMSFLNKPLLLIFSLLLPFALSQESFDSSEQLILEFPAIKTARIEQWPREEEIKLRCTSWRVAGEANNLSPWKKIPDECVDYVKDYVTGKGYEVDLQTVSNEAVIYARSVDLKGDGRDIWIFDIDETLLSNLPYYAKHGYGVEIFNSTEFDLWVERGMAPPIASSLKIYGEILALGFKVFLLTGRREIHRNITVENLVAAGFREWDMLILRSLEDHGKTATNYKSDKRNELVERGYRILGNSGDQWSDLLGSSMSARSFKLPNPMYYIP